VDPADDYRMWPTDDYIVKLANDYRVAPVDDYMVGACG
jgi:hypothetical protein